MRYLPRVVEVQVTGPHRLRLRFDDGNSGEVDFAERQWRGVFEPLADPDCFVQVCLEPGAETISWPSGADLATETLYERAIGHAVPGAAWSTRASCHLNAPSQLTSGPGIRVLDTTSRQARHARSSSRPLAEATSRR